MIVSFLSDLQNAHLAHGPVSYSAAPHRPQRGNRRDSTHRRTGTPPALAGGAARVQARRIVMVADTLTGVTGGSLASKPVAYNGW
jgi:hypothetical protein